ncbi:hypothetical protein GA0061099_1007244 [Bradyrhizobium yuanmingense]|uniref:Uncharacterized protein n=1 Tax=Bradyrhizobium yuanmingense TaxID=108015 RepID=A0A1C3WTM8_9BRAD|nr:hypothetical protein IQ15_05002 [Bradyrhizobium yuanmingense]SCB43300.1 hypothetical protein GA0061099_1007244 [Bradyrhizobium yuanmingense]
MRILIYKRTHSGDPDAKTGVFGSRDCMGTVRGRQYGAVIGIGGIGPEPHRARIAGKLTWVGIAPHKTFDRSEVLRGPRVTFEHFWHAGEYGPLLKVEYPELARRMFDRNIRVLMYSLANSATRLDREITRILRQARRARCSEHLRKRKPTLSNCPSSGTAVRKPVCLSKVEKRAKHRCDSTPKSCGTSNITPKHRCLVVPKTNKAY